MRELSRALAPDFRQEYEFTMKVGTLLALHHSRGEIAHITDSQPAEVKAAIDRLKRVGGEIDDNDWMPQELLES